MALTKLNTHGIGADVILAEDIASNAVTIAELGDQAVSEAKMQISNAGTNGQVLTKQSGNTGGLTWADASGGVSGISSSADATAMTIDSSERIVMPSQPMFYATSISAVSGGSLVNVGASPGFIYNTNGDTSHPAQAVSFGKIWINIGSHWNNTTGQFTCPIAGRYLAYWNNNLHGNSSWPHSFIIHSVNGGAHYRVAMSWQSNAESAEQYSDQVSFAIINAGASDKIWPAYSTSYNSPTTSNNFGYHQCAIMLIG